MSLAVFDILAVSFNLLPIYVQIARTDKNLDSIIRNSEYNTDLVEKIYEKSLTNSFELHSTFSCKFSAYCTNLFRAISGWLVLLLTFYRLMAVSSPMKWNSFTSKYFLKRVIAVIAILAVALAFPLFTKYIYEHELDATFKIKFCHHSDTMGFEFHQFEVILNAIVFPLIPCVLIFPLNILLIYLNLKGQETRYLSMTSQQHKGNTAILIAAVNQIVLGTYHMIPASARSLGTTPVPHFHRNIPSQLFPSRPCCTY